MAEFLVRGLPIIRQDSDCEICARECLESSESENGGGEWFGKMPKYADLTNLGGR